jgi:uncharacterized membrane protein SpoIIM required for sporulation
MREAMFIKKNAEKWKEYQELPTDDPDTQAERFITLLDDLAYSKTFYPQSKVTRWINAIAASIYQSIYRNKKEKYTRIGRFFKQDLPITMYRNRFVLLFTFVLFMLFVLLAVWSSVQNIKFINGILGDGYVNMTEENIEKGDPFGVYRDSNKFSMFAAIMFNNIGVSFLLYVGGITFGLATIYYLFQNGLMLGAFQYMFFAKDLGLKSVLVIWVHGTIEISSIVLAAMAGFIIAKGVMFPGTYSRKESFKVHLMDSLRVILMMIPLLITAAFFESYVTYLMSNSYDKTANESIPAWVSILILAASLSFMIWYFVLYPIKVARRIKAEAAPNPTYLMTA